MKLWPRRRSDRVATGFLLAAVVAYAAMHVLPCSYSPASGPAGEVDWEAYLGYEIWEDLLPSAADFTDPDVLDWVFSMGFLLLSVMVGACPFLVVPLSHSRVLWWSVVLCSGMVVVSLVGVLGWLLVTSAAYDEDWRSGPGLVLFFAAPILNFVGLLCVRKAGDPGASPRPDRSGRKVPQG